MADRITLADGVTVSTANEAVHWRGGEAACLVTGTFGSTSSVTLEFGDGTDFVSLGDDAILTAPGAFGVTLPDCDVRLRVAAGTAVDVTAILVGIPDRQ